MKNPCLYYKCIKCCLETEMPLLKKDIARIKNLEIKYDYFVINNDGWLQLKNYNGKCVFNDGEQCTIYEKRPEGCQLYPIIYDEEKNCATLDEVCPHGREFRISKIKLANIRSLILRLNDERSRRK